MVAHPPGGQGRPQQPAQQGQAGQDADSPVPGLHHLQVLGGHQHDHGHTQGAELGGVGPHRGQGQGALAQGPMGRVGLQQQDLAAGGGAQAQAVGIVEQLGFTTAVGAKQGIGGAGIGEQLGHGGGRCHGQQEANLGPQPRQPIGGLQQKGHAHLQLGPLRAGHQGHPFARRQGHFLAG